MLKKYKEKIKHHFHEVIRTKKSPHSIALGFAIGTFIGILPTPGLNILFGLIIILIFEKVNKFTLFFAIFFWNTLTLAPVHYLSFKIGVLLFGSAQVVKSDFVMLDFLYTFARRYLVGNLILAVTLSIASYFIVKITVNKMRVRKIIKDSE
jgi:uncharacterized protein